MAFAKPLLYAVTPQFAGQAVSLKAHRPQTQIEIFEQAGHALFVDEPGRFAALLAGFLRTNGL
jgi:microsomal epoxide hydrolase